MSTTSHTNRDFEITSATATTCTPPCNISITSVNTTCNSGSSGSENGTITINASGSSNGLYNYSINGGQNYFTNQGNSLTFNSQPSGTYSVVVQDAGNTSCTASTSTTVGSCPPPSSTPTPSPLGCQYPVPNQNATLDASATNISPGDSVQIAFNNINAGGGTFSWSVPGGVVVNSGGGSSDFAINLTFNSTGSYTISSTYSNCADSVTKSVTITVTGTICAVIQDTGATMTPTNVNLDLSTQGNQVQFQILEGTIVGSSPFSYSWSLSGGGTISSGQGTNQIATTWSSTGLYTVQVQICNCDNTTCITRSTTINVYYG